MVLLPSSRYEELNEIGADIIVDGQISEYPFDVLKLAKTLEIDTCSYQSLSEKTKNMCFQESDEGFNVLASKDGQPRWKIFYNEDAKVERKKFTIMHEIVHCSMGHLEGNEVEESEANYVANFILAPPCIIHEKGVEDFLDLAKEFGISQQAAYITIGKYNKWLRYGHSKYTSYEKRILDAYHKGKKKETIA